MYTDDDYDGTTQISCPCLLIRAYSDLTFFSRRFGSYRTEDDFIFNEYTIDDTLDSLSRLENYHNSDFSLQRLWSIFFINFDFFPLYSQTNADCTDWTTIAWCCFQCRLVLVRDVYDTAVDAGYDASVRRLLPLLTNFVSDTEPAVRQVFAEQLFPLATFFLEVSFAIFNLLRITCKFSHSLCASSWLHACVCIVCVRQFRSFVRTFRMRPTQRQGTVSSSTRLSHTHSNSS